MNSLEDFYKSNQPKQRYTFLLEHEEFVEPKAVFEKRFDFQKEEPVDHFMHAWLLLSMSEENPVLFKNAWKKQIQEYGNELCLLDKVNESLKKEWENFACTLRATCLNDKQYRSVIFGLGKQEDNHVIEKMKKELEHNQAILAKGLNTEGVDCFLSILTIYSKKSPTSKVEG